MNGFGCSRRSFLSDLGLGFSGLALGAMLHRDGVVRADAVSRTAGARRRPRANRVIWIFLSGGVSHLESFDPKPMLNKYAGKTYDQQPFPNPQKLPIYRERSRSVVGFDRELISTIFPLQVGYRKHGRNGIEVSDWLPHLATCVDDLTFVRSMYTTDNDHGAEFQMHHGRHRLDEKQPAIGSWINYGLGTLNENLPQFAFLGEFRDTRVKENYDADYLGPRFNGVKLSLDPARPLPFGVRPRDVLEQEQRNQFDFIRQLNRLTETRFPNDAALRARVESYELAFRMQRSIPETLDLATETEETQRLYGLDNPVTALYGRRCLAARRLAERGVRFTLVYLSDYGEWDSHSNLKTLHARSCARVDQPVAGLIKDLKRRGMLDDTLVVWCSEFGRTPAVENNSLNKAATGRDHHPHGFTVWLAGAGLKPGYIHGATDELGFHAVEHPHYVTDLHATLLNLLGLDSRELEIPGRKRLDLDHGTPIFDIMT
jgi:hypothetical protein